MRLLPPLTISSEEIEEGLARLAGSLRPGADSASLLPDGLELDDDPKRIDTTSAALSRVYWGKGRARERECAIEGSTRVVGIYRGSDQVGFARAVTDGAVLAYLADVYVLEPYRGNGLGLELIREIVDGDMQDDVRWMLHTADAAGLYRKLGFRPQAPPYPLMERPPVAGTR